MTTETARHIVQSAIAAGLVTFRPSIVSTLHERTLSRRARNGVPLDAPLYTRSPAKRKHRITVKARDDWAEYMRQWRKIRRAQ